MLELITPASYWILIVLWLIILTLYLGKLKHSRSTGGAVAVLLTLLSIDAFRTLFESVYFGFYFNSMFGLLPRGIYDELSKPGLIIIPKIVNIAAGMIVLTLLIRRWIPTEIQDREDKLKNLEDSNTKLMASEKRFRSLTEKMPVPLIIMDLDGQNIFRNEHFVELFGYTEEIVPTVDDWWLRAYPDPVYRDQVIKTWEDSIEKAMVGNNEIEADEFLVTCFNGEQRIIEISGVVLEDSILITFLDRTEKIRSQAEIEKSRAEFAAIFNSISDGIVFVDAQRHIVRINPAFTQMFGYQLEEIYGLTTQFIYANPDHYLRQGKGRFNPDAIIDQPVFENEYRRKDGTTFPGDTIGVHVVDEAGKLLGYIGVIHDVAERKLADKDREKLEIELRQAHKMEAIGTMVGGIAHNFNNNLAIILGNLEMAQLKFGDREKEAKYLGHAHTATRRASELVRKIMTYSRQDKQSQAPVRIVSIIDETIQLMRSTIPTSIEFKYKVPSENFDITINADATRIQESLINLCTNAVHAMNESGTLTLSLDSVDMKLIDIPAQYKCSQGSYARLSVQDTGSGMSDETIEKIFDPFFTTKEVDKGTGIGLSTVQGIVEKHGGFIKVYSALGHGTKFELHFPLVDYEDSENFVENIELAKGTEKILLIDDEEILAQTIAMMLSAMGYLVTVETKSLHALKRFQQDPNHFDLVITDQTMPEMTGVELAQEFSKMNPCLPIILCTGYSSKVSKEEVGGLGIRAFLTKPLGMPKLLEAVRDVLDETKSNSMVR